MDRKELRLEALKIAMQCPEIAQELAIHLGPAIFYSGRDLERFQATDAFRAAEIIERWILAGEPRAMTRTAHAGISVTTGPMATRALQRPGNYASLSTAQQWEVDKNLDILDWDGDPTK